MTYTQLDKQAEESAEELNSKSVNIHRLYIHILSQLDLTMPDLLQARVEACFKAAERHFNCLFIRPEISFKLRGQKAGVASYKVYGRKIRAHGPEWQAVMQNVYQLPASRCHNYAVNRTVKTHYLYTCACPQREPFALSGQRHARVKKGLHYQCKECRARLVYTHQQLQR